MFEILSDNWLLLLVGQYPQGPLGGLAATIVLALLSLVFSFPLGIVLALCRISPVRVLYWPATAVVYVVRGLPLIMFIFWAYFMVPVIINRPVAGTTTMVVALVIAVLVKTFLIQPFYIPSASMNPTLLEDDKP